MKAMHLGEHDKPYVACGIGRESTKIKYTGDHTQVTCKRCQRSIATSVRTGEMIPGLA